MKFNFMVFQRKKKRSISFVISCLFVAVSVDACGEATTPVSLTAYNHTQTHDIEYFTMNGAGGINVRRGASSPEKCCIVIPNRWRPGLKVSITWRYEPPNDNPNEVMPVITKELELPKYPHPDAIRLHFYENEKIKIILSKCSPKHPFYPLSLEDRLPWKPMSSKSEYRENGGPIDC
jgi:hypothetical protein